MHYIESLTGVTSAEDLARGIRCGVAIALGIPIEDAMRTADSLRVQEITFDPKEGGDGGLFRIKLVNNDLYDEDALTVHIDGHEEAGAIFRTLFATDQPNYSPSAA